MRYKYGVNDNPTESSRTATAKQIASIIKRDVDYGKWNTYKGGNKKHPATVSYENKSFNFHTKMFLFGKESEFKELENLIKDFITVTPRQFPIE